MRRKLLVMLFAGSALFAIPAPGNASTCAAADPTIDYVVCDVVYRTAVEVACKPLAKVCSNID